MKTKIEIKTICGSVIFEYKKENNTFSETVKEYIRKELSSGKSSANLRAADLRAADLRAADLRAADLRYANLSFADLSSADLRYANLSYADLISANLSSADLISANLRFADLSSANLRSTDLRYADLSYADLSSAKNLLYSACYFSGHGECGRQLLAVKIGEGIKLFCGCFKGDEKELRDYIEKGDEDLKESRLLALKTVLKLIEVKNGRY